MGTKITDLTALSSPTTDDILYIINDPGGTPGDRKITVGNLLSGVQPLDATLTALAGLTVAADKGIYATGSDAFATFDLSSFARTLLDDANAGAARTTLGLGTIATLAAPSGTVVGTSDSQTLTNKTIDASANTISNLATSMFAANVVDTDATLAANSSSRIPAQSAVKSYVDNLLTGLKWKASVVAATTANITLSGAQTIDGVSVVANDRVLVKNQSSGAENGIYVAAAGAWSRATDADSGTELVQATVFVEQGTTNADTQWTATNNSITLGSTSVTFAQVSGAGTYTNGSGLSLSGNQFSVASNGITNAMLAQVATATFKGRTTASTGNVEDLTATQATALLNAFVGDSGSGGTKGLVPAPSTGDATKYLKGDGTWATVSGGGAGLTWSEVTGTTQTMSTDTAYVANNASQVVLTLPTTAAVGKVVRVVGKGAGGWKVAQNASEIIHFGNLSSSTGTGGYLESTHRRDAVELVCVVADTEWVVISSQGNITVV